MVHVAHNGKSIHVAGMWNSGVKDWNEITLTVQLHWSTNTLSREEKVLFLMNFWTLNSNIFPEFPYHPHLSLCTSLHMWVTESL
jgi:hypothetical protein